MNIKKLFAWTSVIVGLIALIVVGLLLFNSKSSQCQKTHNFDNQTQMCYFQNYTCPVGTQSSPIPPDPTLNETGVSEYNCLYKPTNFLDNKIFLFTLIFIGVGWFIIFIIFIIDIAKKSAADLNLGEFRKEDYVHANRARFLWALWFSRENNLPMNGDAYKKSAFNFYHKQQVFQKGEEWFVQFQCEVLDGKNPGLYTVCASQSRGEEWILNGNLNWEDCHYKAYKLDPTRPLHTPKNIQERMLQDLAQSNPERAIELQSKMLEEGASKPPQQQYEQIAPDAMPQQFPAYQPPYRPRYRKPFYGRRY